MKKVKFVEFTEFQGRMCSPDRVYEFEDDVADQLVKDGLAKDADQPAKEEKAKSKKK